MFGLPPVAAAPPVPAGAVPAGGMPARTETDPAMLEFLRMSREFLAVQRDVMLGYLQGGQVRQPQPQPQPRPQPPQPAFQPSHAPQPAAPVNMPTGNW
nr:hypothetical protein [Micromonospora sp. DSM 115978]